MVRTLTPEDGEITIDNGVIHSLKIPEGVHTEFAEREDGEEARKKKSDFLKKAIQGGMGGANVSSVPDCMRDVFMKKYHLY